MTHLRPHLAPRLLPPLLALLSACSGPVVNDPKTPEPTGYAFAEGTLRIDVYPPAGVAEPALLPQSHLVLPGDYEIDTLNLYRTLSLSGTVTGDVARGWGLAGAPTTEEPLIATLSAAVAASFLGNSTESDAEGRFTLLFPVYPDSTVVTIVPADATLAPFRVVDALALSTDAESWDQHLPTGIPVYGRIEGTDDALTSGQAGVALRLSRTTNGTVVRSAPFLTDGNGWFLGRVDQPGDYTLEVVGGANGVDGRVIPDLAVPILVEGEAGVAANVYVGDVGSVGVYGSVVDASGALVPGAEIRFRSRALDAGVGSLMAVAGANDGGNFIIRLLPGIYDVEVVPPYSAGSPPTPLLREAIGVVAGAPDFGALSLGEGGRLEGTVVDPDGAPAADVLVTATSKGTDGYLWSTRTDVAGRFSLAVPQSPLTVALTPQSTLQAGAVTYLEIADPMDLGEIALSEGVTVSGLIALEDVAIPYASLDVLDANTGRILAQGVTDSSGIFSLRVVVRTRPETDGSDTGADTGADTGKDSGADSGRDSGAIAPRP